MFSGGNSFFSSASEWMSDLQLIQGVYVSCEGKPGNKDRKDENNMIENLLYGKQTCFCGRKHSTEMNELYIEDGCLKRLRVYVESRKIRKILLLCRKDESEKGHVIQKLLKGTGAVLQKLYIDTDEMTSEIQYAGQVMLRADPQTEIAVIAGKGRWINISRYLCDRLHIPAVLVLTGVPEINFCASWIAVHEDGVPHFHKISEPAAVFADPGIMMPVDKSEILSACFDLLGGQIALYEWRLSHLVTDEYYCAWLEQVFLDVLKPVAETVKRLTEKSSAELLIGTLVETQAAVSLLVTCADNPGLTAGSYWLMKEFWSRKVPPLCRDEKKGTEIGCRYSSLEAAYCMISRIGNMVGDRWKVFEEMDPEYRKDQMHSFFGKQADYLWNLEMKTGKNSREKVFVRRRQTEKCYREIQKIDYLLPSGEVIREMKQLCSFLRREDFPSEEAFYNGLLFAKDMLSCYSGLQFLYDMGRLEQMASQMRQIRRGQE